MSESENVEFLLPVEDQEMFVPCPRITFLIDGTKGLKCPICLETEMTIGGGDSTVSIFPCGHCTCLGCAKVYLDQYDQCPYCRLLLVYPKCQHPMLPRPVDKSNIYYLPKTLPDGGEIPDYCHSCRQKRALRKYRKKLKPITEEFLVARAKYLETRSEADKEQLIALKKAIDAAIEQGFQVYTKCLIDW